MSDPSELPTALAEPLAGIPHGAENHFRLRFYCAILRMIARIVAATGSFEAAFETFPFLANYSNELADHGLAGVPAEQAEARWWDTLRAWEDGCEDHLPLRALREALALTDEEIALVMTIGLPEEDARFGALFESLNGTQGLRRPTVGLLSAWWADAVDVPGLVRRLLDCGLVETVNAEAPRAEWQLAIPDLAWDAMRGTLPERAAPWVRHKPIARLACLDDLLLEPALGERLRAVADMLANRDGAAVVMRGPRANGRHTAVGALAHATGRGMLEVNGLTQPGDARWRTVGPLATLLHAMPVIAAQPAPGETAEIPELSGYAGPLGVVLGRLGGLTGTPVREAIWIEMDIPAPVERRLHWAAGFNGAEVEDLDQICAGFRLTRGNIRRAAALAVQQAALAGRDRVGAGDVQTASRNLNREALETLATRVSSRGNWNHLATTESTFTDLRQLEARCRHRERLGQIAGGAGPVANSGVRALFKGASGTGKTLAAGLLANALGMDIYRIDLAAVVNKYIGETEKNLEQAFSRAEELDVILLIDEGDALLTRRTEVNTSNDRYANLETNYLLQRIESYTGILIVTTNAGDRIDGAFARRMDVVVEFAPPQAEQRWAIWKLHLANGHAVDSNQLWEIADRCALTGGQIRNAALHAALLTLDDSAPISATHVMAAVRREYRKSGAVCPLPANL